MLILVFVITAISAYLLSRTANLLGLIAHPGEHRLHQQSTPLVGGIAIFIGLVAGYFLMTPDYANLLPGLALLCVVGALDDRFKLPSWTRFLAQGVAACLMIKLTGMQLTNLGSLVSDNDVLLHRWSIALTVFATIGVINAINMSDGLDGLAGCLVVLVLMALLLCNTTDRALIYISIASISGFLVWNLRIFRQYASMFMGDAGSTVLGLILAYLLITTTQQADINSLINLAPVTALWFLALPLFDAVAVLLVRPLRGQSPFSADRIHYHHLLLDAGLSVNQVLVTALFVQAIFIVTGCVMGYFGLAEKLQFVAFLLCFVGYFLILLRVTRK